MENSSSTKTTSRNNRLSNLISGPRNFAGEFRDGKGDIHTSGAEVEASAKFWLRRMNEIRDNCQLSDREILFVAGDKLIGNAERWWDMCYDNINNWEEFEIAFKAQFMDEDIEKYWSELDTLKQQNNETVEQISTRFKALLHLVGDKDIPEREKVRRYLHTIHSNIARGIVKKEGKPITLATAILSAKQVESANLEFNNNDLGYDTKRRDIEINNSNKNKESERQEASMHNTADDSASVISELTKEIAQLKIFVVEMQQQQQQKQQQKQQQQRNNYQNGNYGRGYQQQYQQYPRSNNTGPRLCFNCHSPDHLQYECPQPPQQQQGKDQEQ
ncbi:hypothetical protein G6F42_010584 [Rhizopus arrhizus]|nr:hypothetical protein G6F42_010584 [Rhizopus arrhizus]